MSTGCEFYADALVELAAGNLEAERAERVEAHVTACEDCRRALMVIRRIKGAPAHVPEGLEARIRTAVRGVKGAAPPARNVRMPRGPWRDWRPWALPVAAAAGLAVWLGVSTVWSPDPNAGAGDGAAVAEYEPYGAWPGSNGVVAGELVLSELSVAELEALLEEMR
jgi:anti-sigma factor RsiW